MSASTLFGRKTSCLPLYQRKNDELVLELVLWKLCQLKGETWERICKKQKGKFNAAYTRGVFNSVNPKTDFRS